MGAENARREITEKGTAKLIDDLDLLQSSPAAEVRDVSRAKIFVPG